MELLIAILFALKGFIEPGLTNDQLREKYPTDCVRAQIIIDNNFYRVEPETGIIIIDETGD